MRSLLLTLASGVCLTLTISPASSMATAAPAGLLPATQALALTEAIHCRRYPHWHANERRWSRGCGVGAVGGGTKRSGVARAGLARSPSNFLSPSNPQDRLGSSNRQDMTQPRSMNPQDMR
jgi:hypothetical protein